MTATPPFLPERASVESDEAAVGAGIGPGTDIGPGTRTGTGVDPGIGPDAGARYVHGYAMREAERLEDQARVLEDLLHHDTRFADGAAVLEAGCGTGAQTIAIARRNPSARITAVDIAPMSIAAARERMHRAGRPDVDFIEADLGALPFAPMSFDEILVCFVLEHLPAPVAMLGRLLPLLRPGGRLTVIEGDHGSVLMSPDSAAARAAIDCQVELQRRAGGDPDIGRRLYPLLVEAGLDEVVVTPRVAYADAGRPAAVVGFTERTFTAMIAGVREPALAAGLTTPAAFDAGLAGLRRTMAPDGSFSYTFFKATGRLRSAPAAPAASAPSVSDVASRPIVSRAASRVGPSG